MPIKKTHSIEGLRDELKEGGIPEMLSDDEAELLDSIYLPSKYPLGSILPFFTPDEDIAQRCVSIAERVVKVALSRIEKA
jgi:HEPN domain-containing protein